MFPILMKYTLYKEREGKKKICCFPDKAKALISEKLKITMAENNHLFSRESGLRTRWAGDRLFRGTGEVMS